MSKYRVFITKVTNVHVDVNAESKEEARKIGWRKILLGEIKFESFASSTNVQDVVEIEKVE